jgi:VanZ family protein
MHFSAEQRTVLRLAWLAAISVVIVGSLLPGNSFPLRLMTRLHLSDKVQHLTAYAVLAFIPALHEKRSRVVVAAISVVALGVVLEFAQSFSVERMFEVADMLADTLGVVSGLTIALLFRSASASDLVQLR